MILKKLAVALYFISMFLNGFTLSHNNSPGPLGFQLVFFGWIATESLRPFWTWLSYLANISFLYCCFEPSTKGRLLARRVTAVVGVLLGLTFLAVREYYASGSVGHNSRYYWTAVRPAAGYFIWLSSHLLMLLHTMTTPPPEQATPS